MADNFDVNLLRLIASELYFLSGLQAAREMFGKSYFSLGAAEKSAVDNAVAGMTNGNMNLLSPEYLNSLLTKPTQAKPDPTPTGPHKM